MAIKAKNKKSPGKNNMSLIGNDAEFEGNLRFFGTVRIDGNFRGTISGDGTIIVGEHGILKTDVHVPNVIIYGEVYGDVIAEDRIDLHESGRVFGNIQAPILKIDPGAILQGNCKTLQVKYADVEEATMTSSVKAMKIQNVALLPVAS